MSKTLTDIELLEQGLVIGTREEAMKYYQAYRRYGTSQMHPVDAIFNIFQGKGVSVCTDSHLNKSCHDLCAVCGAEIEKLHSITGNKDT